MSDLNVDWTAIGTLALAVVTALLALATVWLGRKTSKMAAATREMADATKQLVGIESARRADEGRARLIIEHREMEPPSDSGLHRLPLAMRATRVRVQNTGQGEATDIRVVYRDGDRGGEFYRDRLGSFAAFSFPEHDFEERDPPADLHASSDRYMRVSWTDARGSHSSPTYLWVDGRTGTPTILGSEVELPS